MVLLQSRTEVIATVLSHSFRNENVNGVEVISKTSFTTSRPFKDDLVNNIRFIAQVVQLNKNMYLLNLYSGKVSSQTYTLITVPLDYNQHFPGIKLPISDLKLLRHFNVGIDGTLGPTTPMTRLIGETIAEVDERGFEMEENACMKPGCTNEICSKNNRKIIMYSSIVKSVMDYIKTSDEIDEPKSKIDEVHIDNEKLLELRTKNDDDFIIPLGQKYKVQKPLRTNPVPLDTDLQEFLRREYEEEMMNKMIIEKEAEDHHREHKAFRGTPFGKSFGTKAHQLI